MGLYKFTNEFEILVQHPKDVAFERLFSYVEKSKNLDIKSSEKFNKLFFSKSPNLFSWSVKFEVNFQVIDDNNTKLSVKSTSGSIDLGKSKEIISDIVKEIY